MKLLIAKIRYAFGIRYLVLNHDKYGKVLVLFRVRFGKCIWSKWLIVEKALSNEGTPNAKFDKQFEKWIGG